MDTRKLIEIAEQDRLRGLRMSWSEKIFVVFLFGCLLTFLVGAIWMGAVWAARNREAHARFMRQCMEDHKEYECTALWRAGDRSGPDVILLPMPIPK